MARDIFIKGIVTDNVPDGFVACCEEYDCGADVFVQRWGRISNQNQVFVWRLILDFQLFTDTYDQMIHQMKQKMLRSTDQGVKWSFSGETLVFIMAGYH